MTDSHTETKSGEEISAMLPIRMTSRVVRGFGRGSADLGIPTANLDPSQLVMHLVPTRQPLTSLPDLPCGIYWGFCRIGGSGHVYTAAVSIGYNPTYGNDQKTIEPHLIAPESDPRRHASCSGETVLQDFYEQPVRLSVVGYLRPELPFEGLDKLVEAIKKDIVNSVRLGQAEGVTESGEYDWVESSDQLV